MSKIFVILSILALIHTGLALKCHSCMSACEVSKAENKECGLNIGPSQDVFCTTHVPKSNPKSMVAVRRCEVVTKGHNPVCPEGTECTSCQTDFCNDSSDASRIPPVAFVTTLFTFLIHRYLM